jgi:hypothetical protein
MQHLLRIGQEELAFGPEVRPEYLKLCRDLVQIARAFSLDLPAQHQRDAALLVFASECVDRILDALPTSAQRAQFSADVLAVLGGATIEPAALTREVADRLAQLREVAQRRRIEPQVMQITARIFRNCEAMRATRDASSYVRGAALEGRLLVELLLLILGDSATPGFRDFMREVGEPANLGDKLRDAGQDFAAGEIAINPGVCLRARLACEISRRVLVLAIRFCARWRLAVWGFKSILVEIVFFRAQPARS